MTDMSAPRSHFSITRIWCICLDLVVRLSAVLYCLNFPICVMRKRSAAIVLLVVSLLVSAWGNVIAASFCPQYGMTRDNGFTQVSHKPMHVEAVHVEQEPSCHTEMTDMNSDSTDNMVIENSESSESAESITSLLLPAGASDVNVPTQTCGHCWMHSQAASGSSTLGTVDPSMRLTDANTAPTNLVLASPSNLTPTIALLEHGPPGNAFPRHLLINVFRI